MSVSLPGWAILAIRWAAAVSCPLWLGIGLLIAIHHLSLIVSLFIHPEDDMLAGAAKVLYRRLMLAEPFLIGLPVAFCVGSLAPRWKFYAALIIAFVPVLLHTAYHQVTDLMRGSDLDPISVSKNVGLILGAALGCWLVLKVFGNAKEAV